MTDRLRLVSHFPGRLRVRARTFRVLPEVGDSVAQRLREEPGVTRVDVTVSSGSVLVQYDPRAVQLPRIIQVLLRIGGLRGLEMDESPETAQAPAPGVRVRESMDGLDEALRRATGGSLDLRTAVPGALATAGVGALLFGRRLVPTWYDLFFWSFVTFVNLNPPARPARTDGRTV